MPPPTSCCACVCVPLQLPKHFRQQTGFEEYCLDISKNMLDKILKKQHNVESEMSCKENGMLT